MKIWAKTILVSSFEIRIFWDGYESTVPLGPPKIPQTKYLSRDPVLLATITLVLDRGELILNTFTYKKPINNTLKTKKNPLFSMRFPLSFMFLFYLYPIVLGGGEGSAMSLFCHAYYGENTGTWLNLPPTLI